MSIHVALSHTTRYRYDRLVTLSPHVVRLRPAPHCRTPVLSYSLTVSPRSHFLNWQQDPHSNYLARVVFPEKVRELEVQVDLVAELAVYNPFDFFLEPSADWFPFRYDASLAEDLAPFLALGPETDRLRQYLSTIECRPRQTIDFLVDLNRRLSRDITYVIRLEPGVQTPEETLSLARGSCRDTGWLLVQLLRRLGLAARFVSGYLIQLSPDRKALDGPSGTEVEQPFPKAERAWQISVAGGRLPRWRDDGRAVFFLSDDGRVMQADVETLAGGFQVGPPRPLFEIGTGSDYEPDGAARFLVKSPVSEAGDNDLEVVMNWAADLSR